LPEHHRRGLRDAVAAGDVGAVARHAAALSGCGPGLTPSGDDFLAGWMLALWATHHPGRQALCETICRSAQGRTTRLSLAFLEAARRGEADQRWHNLLLALSEGGEGDVDTIAAAMAAISSFGATSGVDMLDGFVEGISVVTQPTCGQ
ncbi:MAG: DUF2877 domain-containing protein, partial [Anaerolineae bacterium]|nr:DUF2877 domain-containing protein [Anaerolineae bacterium]